MSIEEGNKLIFLFDGWTIEKGMESMKNPFFNKGFNMFLLSKAEFHTSWDWLMPTVSEIESIEDAHHGYFGVHIISNSCTIQATKLRTDQPMAQPPHYFSDHQGNTKIQATWEAVVQFIKWRNGTAI